MNRLAYGRAVELFAGIRRFASACAKEGMSAESWELMDSRDEDVMEPSNTAYIGQNVINSTTDVVLMGFVCGSWFLARRSAKGYGHGFPPPLRGNQGRELWGLPNLNAKDPGARRLGQQDGPVGRQPGEPALRAQRGLHLGEPRS